MIAIINGCGTNIASVQFALDRLGKKSVLTTDSNIIKQASHVILPGVGTANYAMSQLKKNQLIDVIRNLKQPVLGICLGMQLLYECSQEGNIDCLNILPGQITPLLPQVNVAIPHMGWNQLKINATTSKLLQGIKTNSYVYFVHSYKAPISEHTEAVTMHGVSFSAVVNKNNFFGVQFHPERSSEVGEKLLSNFLAMS